MRAGNFYGLALLLLLAARLPALAQQTIFNVPSTDVLDRGKVYFELDASFKPSDSQALGSFSSFVPRIVVGAGRRAEVGLNVTGNVQPGPDATTFVPTFKLKVYDGGRNGWAVVAGDHVFIPARNRAYRAGNYAYAEVGKTFKLGTRLTAGAYDFTRRVVAAANRAGGQFGFEHPINKKGHVRGGLLHRLARRRVFHARLLLQTHAEGDGLRELSDRQPEPRARQQLLPARSGLQRQLNVRSPS